MSVISGKGSSLIIDRTIPEILRLKRSIRRDALLDFCQVLSQAGGDLIEINRDAVTKMVNLPKGIEFILRIEDQHDMELCLANGFKYCVIKYNRFLDSQLQYQHQEQKINTILEIDIDNPKKLKKLTELKGLIGSGSIYCLRIQGLSKFVLPVWSNVINLVKENLHVKVDICPKNKFYLATAIALAGLQEGADFVTTTFTGRGGLDGFAALEEVILASKVIAGLKVNGDTTLFFRLYKLYQELTGTGVPGIKAIIGHDIFKYESGIHADGIAKNPTTYEPYEPAVVGQQRKLILGKHSGSTSVINKLKELKIPYKTEKIAFILKEIRKTSIELKREIHDDELIKICSNLGEGFPYASNGRD